MKRPRGKKPSPPLSPSEKYGNLWGWMYVAIVIILIVTIVGKALLKKG